ncbi:MAG: UDP-N-acetylglucosamine 2-epimerase (non-hydrolyzing) [Acidobacteriota bacterium]
MLKVINVVGARPNFMKVAPIVEEMKRREREFAPLVVHTGQHYDAGMSDAFFRDLELPEPDVYLGVGSGSHAAQTAAVMARFEPVVVHEEPDWVLVVGDVNSTLACALVCAKMGVKVAHVEAGLRSRDRTMPEEINRLLTDQISDLLFTPSEDADQNLLAEGIPRERIRFVGNVMIDSLLQRQERAESSKIRETLGVADRDYAVVTLHRPSNVDSHIDLSQILHALEEISQRVTVVFPLHPRTRKTMAEFGIAELTGRARNIHLTDPLGYVEFLRLLSGARLVLTDSGGIQEETTALGIPCLTLRENTERPITIEMGTNKLVGNDPLKIVQAAFSVLDGLPGKPRRVPPLWDGHTAERIVSCLLEVSAGMRQASAELPAR